METLNNFKVEKKHHHLDKHQKLIKKLEKKINEDAKKDKK